ncbi:hypothetical protein Plhal304r1_c039g0116761 [Plasmopara halstedii]
MSMDPVYKRVLKKTFELPQSLWNQGGHHTTDTRRQLTEVSEKKYVPGASCNGYTEFHSLYAVRAPIIICRLGVKKISFHARFFI